MKSGGWGVCIGFGWILRSGTRMMSLSYENTSEAQISGIIRKDVSSCSSMSGMWTSKAPASGSVSSDGVLGGVVGGYSWQSGPYVIGVEGDFLASDISGSRHFNGGLNQVSPSIDTMADLRLRAGYAVTPRVLLFGTFGGAWANVDLPIIGPGGGIRETTFFGWSAGAGAELALNPNWSARIDYQFTDFDSETVSYPGGKQTFDPDANSFRGSIIYRF